MAWLGRFDDFNIVNVDRSLSKQNLCNRPSVSKGAQMQDKARLRFCGSNQFSHQSQGYCRISEITKDMQTVGVKGIIIAKEGPKTVTCKKGSGTERHLLAMTVCDEPLAFINVTCWSGNELINLLANELSIGDVVDIKGAHVQAKSSNPSDEKFKPWTPCPCQLNVSENQGTIAPYTGTDASEYLSLLHVPTRANNDFYTLEDIQANGMNLQGEHINILSVVKKIWPMREIVTKFGKKTLKSDVILCDETCPSFNLTLWDGFVHLAEHWAPMETVIFAADVRISFNEFHSAMAASTDSKTIFTVDPDTPEAQSLRHFCNNQGPYNFFNDPENCTSSTYDKDPDVESITNVITIKEAKKLQTDAAFIVGQPQYGVIFAFLSHFDIDSDEKYVFRDVCSRCHRSVQEETNFICGNPDCAGSDGPFESNTEVDYSFTVSLSDHTGTIDFCRVPQNVAEHLLGYKARDFKNLTALQRTAIKWCYLFERVKAVVKMKKSNGERKFCFVKVLSLEKPSPVQILEQGFTNI